MHAPLKQLYSLTKSTAATFRARPASLIAVFLAVSCWSVLWRNSPAPYQVIAPTKPSIRAQAPNEYQELRLETAPPKRTPIANAVTTSPAASAPGVALTGRVLINHLAQAGVRVTASVPVKSGLRRLRSTLTDDLGHYELHELPPGPITIKVSAKPNPDLRDFAPLALREIDLPDKPSSVLDIEAPAGSVRITITTKAAPKTQSSGPLAEIGLVFLDFCQDAAPGGVPSATHNVVTGQIADDHGTFTYKNIPIGHYELSINAVNAAANTPRFEVHPYRESLVEIELTRAFAKDAFDPYPRTNPRKFTCSRSTRAE